MKIIFFGLGSIGKRHANILKDKFGHELFAFRSNGKRTGEIEGINELVSWEEVREAAPEVAFITNPTFLHIDTAVKCAELNMKLFIEKPLGSSLEGLDDLIKTVQGKDIVSYVAYNLRFHPVIEYLKEYLAGKNIYHVDVRASSHLSDWREGKEAKDTYSASSEQGGGVILDLSHEFDYIKYVFGEIEHISGVFGRTSEVTKDAEDYADVLILTGATPVNLHMDCMSWNAERYLKIDTEEESIFADLLNNKIEFRKGGAVKTKDFDSGIRDTYETQLRYFFDNINDPKMMNNITDASVLFRNIMDLKESKK